MDKAIACEGSQMIIGPEYLVTSAFDVRREMSASKVALIPDFHAFVNGGIPQLWLWFVTFALMIDPLVFQPFKGYKFLGRTTS
jgi:hypothetical protein